MGQGLPGVPSAIKENFSRSLVLSLRLLKGIPKGEILLKYKHQEIKSKWALYEDAIFSYPISKEWDFFICSKSKLVTAWNSEVIGYGPGVSIPNARPRRPHVDLPIRYGHCMTPN